MAKHLHRNRQSFFLLSSCSDISPYYEESCIPALTRSQRFSAVVVLPLFEFAAILMPFVQCQLNLRMIVVVVIKMRSMKLQLSSCQCSLNFFCWRTAEADRFLKHARTTSITGSIIACDGSCWKFTGWVKTKRGCAMHIDGLFVYMAL